jgi:predicted phosphohydrolase
MRVLAIADPHLSRAAPKPMDIFGGNWQGHPEAFFAGWRETVRDDDLVLVPGDISWAMRLKEAQADLDDLGELPGTKVLLRGNHDYWWPSISRLRQVLPPSCHAIQNDALKFGDVIIAGTRGWLCPGAHGFTEQDEKIYQREVERLRLSLASARRLGPGRLVVMLHFPPFNFRGEESAFIRILRKAAPAAVVFGHVHGESVEKVLSTDFGLPMHFVAADALNFRPAVILEAAGN